MKMNFSRHIYKSTSSLEIPEFVFWPTFFVAKCIVWFKKGLSLKKFAKYKDENKKKKCSENSHKKKKKKKNQGTFDFVGSVDTLYLKVVKAPSDFNFGNLS